MSTSLEKGHRAHEDGAFMEPVVATGGNQRQIDLAPNPRRQAKTLAVGCHRLPETFHGKQGVCRGLPPVAGGPLPAREEVDFLSKRQVLRTRGPTGLDSANLTGAVFAVKRCRARVNRTASKRSAAGAWW